VRVRTTATAVLVVAVALVAGGILLLTTLRHRLTDDVRTAAELRADDVVGTLEAGTAPADLALGNDDDLVVQVLDEDGDIVRASGFAVTDRPLADLEPGESTRLDHPPVVGDEEEGEDYLAVAAGADTATGDHTVLVARTLEVEGQSTRTVAGALAIGVPLLSLLVGAITWRVVGRALSPVERIRSEVDEISAAELHRRVPDPAGDDEIARLARTMNRMLERLEGAQSRQRRFVSDASHELRSPVASIRQQAEVALAHPERATTAELAEGVLADDLRIEQLVEDLLLLARADEGRLRETRRPVDLDDLVFEEAARVRSTSSVAVDTGAVSAGNVEGDAAQLRRLLRNLTENATRHARQSIGIGLSQSDGAVTLTVDDDGPGIAEDQRTRVFERFVRLDEARDRDAGGSGLGLAIVAEVVAAHDGSVTVDRSPLGGARFTVTIPAAIP